ncbi:hypothetical protein DYB26_016562, partial [Aphanomyces astaci]
MRACHSKAHQQDLQLNPITSQLSFFDHYNMVKFAVIAAVGAFATAKISPSIHRHLEANHDVDVVVEFRDGNQPALRAANLETATIQTRGARIAHVRSLLESNMETSQRAAVELL